MKRIAVTNVTRDTEDEDEDEDQDEEEDESEEERRQVEAKSKLILDSLNSDLRERALRMLRQVEAGSRRRRDRDGGKEFEDRSDDLRINTWNQLEVFAPVVAAAWHSKAARKSATAWQCIPVIPYAYARVEVERPRRQPQSYRSGSDVRERESQTLGSSGRPNVAHERRPLSVSERLRRSSRLAAASERRQERRTQRSETTRERNNREASQVFVSEDSTSEDSTSEEERVPRRKIKSTEQALREAREILKKREVDRKIAAEKAAEKDALEAILFPANAPPPKLFAAPSKLREQGLEEIGRRERGLIDRTFDPNLTTPIDRHQRTINRTDSLRHWESQRNVPSWEERMAYLRKQSPPRSRRPTLEADDDGFNIGRAETPIVDPYPSRHNDEDRVPDSFPLGVSRSGPQRERSQAQSYNDERGSGSSSVIRRLEDRHQSQSQPPYQAQAPVKPAPPATGSNQFPRGPREFWGTRAAETPALPGPAAAPKTDWRNSEWMAQYQAQAAYDPLAQFYGK